MEIKKNILYYVNVAFFILWSMYMLFTKMVLSGIDVSLIITLGVVIVVTLGMAVGYEKVRQLNFLDNNVLLRHILEASFVVALLAVSFVVRSNVAGKQIPPYQLLAVLVCMLLSYGTARFFSNFAVFSMVGMLFWPVLMSRYAFSLESVMKIVVIFAAVFVASMIFYMFRDLEQVQRIGIILFVLVVVNVVAVSIMMVGNPFRGQEFLEVFLDFERSFSFEGYDKYYYLSCLCLALVGAIRMWHDKGSYNCIVVFLLNVMLFVITIYGAGSEYTYIMVPFLGIVGTSIFGINDFGGELPTNGVTPYENMSEVKAGAAFSGDGMPDIITEKNFKDYVKDNNSFNYSNVMLPGNEEKPEQDEEEEKEQKEQTTVAVSQNVEEPAVSDVSNIKGTAPDRAEAELDNGMYVENTSGSSIFTQAPGEGIAEVAELQNKKRSQIFDFFEDDLEVIENPVEEKSEIEEQTSVSQTDEWSDTVVTEEEKASKANEEEESDEELFAVMSKEPEESGQEELQEIDELKPIELIEEETEENGDDVEEDALRLFEVESGTTAEAEAEIVSEAVTGEKETELEEASVVEIEAEPKEEEIAETIETEVEPEEASVVEIKAEPEEEEIAETIETEVEPEEASVVEIKAEPEKEEIAETVETEVEPEEAEEESAKIEAEPEEAETLAIEPEVEPEKEEIAETIEKEVEPEETSVVEIEAEPEKEEIAETIEKEVEPEESAETEAELEEAEAAAVETEAESGMEESEAFETGVEFDESELIELEDDFLDIEEEIEFSEDFIKETAKEEMITSVEEANDEVIEDSILEESVEPIEELAEIEEPVREETIKAPIAAMEEEEEEYPSFEGFGGDEPEQAEKTVEAIVKEPIEEPVTEETAEEIEEPLKEVDEITEEPIEEQVEIEEPIEELAEIEEPVREETIKAPIAATEEEEEEEEYPSFEGFGGDEPEQAEKTVEAIVKEPTEEPVREETAEVSIVTAEEIEEPLKEVDEITKEPIEEQVEIEEPIEELAEIEEPVREVTIKAPIAATEEEEEEEEYPSFEGFGGDEPEQAENTVEAIVKEPIEEPVSEETAKVPIATTTQVVEKVEEPTAKVDEEVKETVQTTISKAEQARRYLEGDDEDEYPSFGGTFGLEDLFGKPEGESTYSFEQTKPESKPASQEEQKSDYVFEEVPSVPEINIVTGGKSQEAPVIEVEETKEEDMRQSEVAATAEVIEPEAEQQPSEAAPALAPTALPVKKKNYFDDDDDDDEFNFPSFDSMFGTDGFDYTVQVQEEKEKVDIEEVFPSFGGGSVPVDSANGDPYFDWSKVDADVYLNDETEEKKEEKPEVKNSSNDQMFEWTPEMIAALEKENQ